MGESANDILDPERPAAVFAAQSPGGFEHLEVNGHGGVLSQLV
jgi:hypothetical protein